MQRRNAKCCWIIKRDCTIKSWPQNYQRMRFAMKNCMEDSRIQTRGKLMFTQLHSHKLEWEVKNREVKKKQHIKFALTHKNTCRWCHLHRWAFPQVGTLFPWCNLGRNTATPARCHCCSIGARISSEMDMGCTGSPSHDAPVICPK